MPGSTRYPVLASTGLRIKSAMTWHLGYGVFDFEELTRANKFDGDTITVYNSPMHVIAKPALVEFWEKHPDAQSPLQAWYRTMQSEVFADFNDLRATFASADYLDDRTVFNIGGNKYRLISVIHYNRHKVFIRAVLTHAEYDRGDWKRKR